MRIIRAQINWPRTEYSSLILLKDFFNNIDRKRAPRRARRLHPLGAGDVRPGRHAARNRQMGIRAAQWSTARDRDRPCSLRRDYPARRPGLSVIAARSVGGAAAGVL